jgi:hypothetical protein
VANRLYETREDKAREGEFMRDVETTFKCRLHKLPISWQIDALVSRNKKLVAFAEFKCRNHAKGDFPSVILSEHKTEKAFYWQTHLAKDDYTDAPFLLFIRYGNVDCYAIITKDVFSGSGRKKLTAANHKEDPLDTEWVRYIDIKHFKEF